MTLPESRLHWSTSASATPHPDPSPTPTTGTPGDDEHLVHGQRSANEQPPVAGSGAGTFTSHQV